MDFELPGEDGMIVRSLRFLDLETPIEDFNSWLTPASRFPDPLLASFVALPRPNRFDDLLTAAVYP